MILVLLSKYDQVTEVTEDMSGLSKELANHKLICYYVMNNGSICEDKAIFKRPEYVMQQRHLKPLFIWVKVEMWGLTKCWLMVKK